MFLKPPYHSIMFRGVFEKTNFDLTWFCTIDLVKIELKLNDLSLGVFTLKISLR